MPLPPPQSGLRRSAPIIVVAALAVLTALGCATGPAPPMSPSGTARHGLFRGRASSDDEFDAALTAAVNDPRTGSTLAAPHRASTAVEPRQLNSVMSELRTLGSADPAVQAKLIDDLERTDPSLWPLVTQTYRDTLAFKATSRAGESGGSLHAQFAQGENQLSAAHGAIAPGTANDLAAEYRASRMGERSPGSVLALPAASQDEQVVLRSAAPQTSANSPNVVLTSAAPAAALPTATAVSATPASETSPIVASAGATPAAPPGMAMPPAPVVDPPVAQPPTAADAAAFAPFADNNSSGEPPMLPTVSGVTPISAAATPAPATPVSVGQAAYAQPVALSAPATPTDLSSLPALVTQIESQAATPAGAAQAAAARQQLKEAADRLALVSPLALSHLAFCSEIASYGVVTPFMSNEFAPGQQVLIYAEVEHFKSEPLSQGFRTVLRSSYDIFDESGARVAGTEGQTMEEICHNPRRDYFLRYRLNLPQPLAEGTYTLQLSVTDTLSQKSAQSSIRFTIKDKK